MTRTPWILVVFSCLVACSAEVEPVGQSSSELVTSNRLAANRLAANRLAANRLAANRLAANRLAANRLAANRLAANRLAANRLAANRLAANRLATNEIALDGETAGDLLATEDGREVLSFVIGCALPEQVTLVATYDGTPYEFPGAIGLAPHWLTRPLDREDQRWISACLFARVNAYGTTVQISMRGPNRALTTSADEMASWSLEEGAFWGNWFLPGDEPIDWNACRGVDQAAGETGALVDRDCTEPDPNNPGFTLCGLKYAGDCGDFAEEPACDGYDDEGMYYERCAAPESHGMHHEVITTFVRP